LRVTVEYIRYRIPPGQAEAFESAYRRAVGPLSSSPYCLDYELTRCEEDPESYILRITWTSTKDHLEGFRGSEAFRAFFAEIKDYVAAIEEMRHYAPVDLGDPTLFEWAGGAPAFEKLFEEFYHRVGADPVLAPLFAGMDAEHPRYVAAWLTEVFGGPAAYSSQRGGHRHMISRHLGKAITEHQRRRWADLLIATADDIGLPADPEFRSAFAGYLEWGTRMAVTLSQPGVQANVPEPMPRWGWGEVHRPYSQADGPPTMSG
jgi:hemoglobin